MKKNRGIVSSVVRTMVTVVGSIAGAKIAGWAYDQVSR